LSLDLPEEKKEEAKDKKGEKKDEGKKDEAKKEEPKKEEPKKEEPAKPKTTADLEKEALEKRQAEFMAKYTGQASVFNKAGVKFGFSTLSAKPANIQSNLRRMIKSGLSEDAALASLTTTPAELLGVSDRLGSIDNGKIANLVISDKPYFNEKAKVKYVFVDGTLYKMESKEAKKGDPNAKVEAAGSWTMTVESPQSKDENTVTIKKDGSTLSGTISGSRITQPTNLEGVALDGNALSFKYTIDIGGQSVTVAVEVTIDGDTFKGTATAGQFGSFPAEGKKNPK
jgi:hypothetical protein